MDLSVLAYSPGPIELALLAGVVLLLFGNRLPGVMRSVGKSIVEFKKGVREIDEETEEDSAPPASRSGGAV